ncbi:MAG: MarR family winged helix-turn-helix transcriptional regulator [Mycobacteriales bacterium]
MSHPTLDVKRAYLALRRALERTVKPFDLSVAQFDVLQILLHHDGLEHRELAHRLAIASPTLSSILDRMERDGHVRRVTDAQDARVRRIHLGTAARALVASPEFCDAGDRLVEQMLRGFTAEEQRTLFALLARVEHNLDD